MNNIHSWKVVTLTEDWWSTFDVLDERVHIPLGNIENIQHPWKVVPL